MEIWNLAMDARQNVKLRKDSSVKAFPVNVARYAGMES